MPRADRVRVGVFQDTLCCELDMATVAPGADEWFKFHGLVDCISYA